MNKLVKNNTNLYLTIASVVITVIGAILFFFRVFGWAIIMLSSGLSLFVYMYQQYQKNKEEERLLFTSLFVLVIFLFTISVSIISIASNNTSISSSIILIKYFSLVCFSLLILALIFRIRGGAFVIGSYLCLFITLIIGASIIFTNI